MALFNYPNINVVHKTNEQNIQSIKSFLTSQADDLNYQVTRLETRIELLENEIKNLKGESN